MSLGLKVVQTPLRLMNWHFSNTGIQHRARMSHVGQFNKLGLLATVLHKIVIYIGLTNEVKLDSINGNPDK